ncbi:hypothetical protein M0812_24137 [Anaeramoeba flamelloides]|uniref:Uncharacterized protein n=1 Tax=Anaeramoeba flamelloides TaxID=1746091 RepID=A0AAV7YGB5_9EUKA|nr:hypothetical protein M0812_24137 [Anaeramoeba flamelloides]
MKAQKLEKYNENRKKSSIKLKPLIKKQLNVSLSIRAIQRYWKNNDWTPVKPITIPKLSQKDKEKRKMYCRLHYNYDWKRLSLLCHHGGFLHSNEMKGIISTVKFSKISKQRNNQPQQQQQQQQQQQKQLILI